MNIRGSRTCLAAMGAALLAASCGGSSSSSNGPTISPIAATTVNQDNTALVPLSITDGQAAASSLKVAATAADSNLVLPQGISLQNTGGTYNLMITPLTETTGSTTINVMVTDPKGATASTSFMLTVKAVDVDFSAIADQVAAATETADPLTMDGFTVVQDSDCTLPPQIATLATSAFGASSSSSSSSSATCT